jgi:hypothetical protein
MTNKRNKLSVLAGVLSTTLTTAVLAAPGTLTNSPLAVTGATPDPNIMLLFDTSNSMKALVTESVYNENITYTNCPADITLPPTNAKLIAYVKYSGKVYFYYDGTTFYDWGPSASAPANVGHPRRCFNPVLSYSAKLFADKEKSASGGYIAKSGAGRYSGNFLNWYFSNAEHTKGDNFGVTDGFTERKKPGTETRIGIVKQAGTILVNNLEDVRLGLASFQSTPVGSKTVEFGDADVHTKEGKDGAKIHVTLDNVENNASEIITAIDGMNEFNMTAGTPLGEAFADLGRYYIQGSQNQTLTLNADTASTTIQGKDLFTSEPVYFEDDDKPTSSNGQAAIQYECQNNFIVGLTDGFPHSDGDKPGDVSTTLGTYLNGGGDKEILDDVTAALFDTDLRTDLAEKNSVRSYMVCYSDECDTPSLTGNLTVDNIFTAYISTSDTEQGVKIAEGDNWQTSYTLDVDLDPEQDYYLHVKAENSGVQTNTNPGAFLGEFTLHGNRHNFDNDTPNILTAAAHWQASATGWGNYVQATHQGNNDSEDTIWFRVAGGKMLGVNLQSDWIWSAKNFGADGDRFVYFSTKITSSPSIMQRAVEAGGGELKVASSAVELAQVLKETIDSAANIQTTSAAVAFNSQNLSKDTALFKVEFNPADWSGSLQAFKVDENDGTIASSAEWDAALKLNTNSGRFILSHDGTNGIVANWTNLSNIPTQTAGNLPLQKPDLDFDSATNAADGKGQDRLNYILGDRSKENNEATGYRKRSTVLGDIVNSAPVYVGQSSVSWPDEAPFGATNKRHASFKDSLSKTRTPVIYAGANDGMLHGFNATTGETNSGQEVLAYIPSQVFNDARYQGLHALTNKSYQHRYYVDLTPTVSDTYIKNGTSKDWRTVLIGGLRAGGKGYFALDITKPSDFKNANKEKIVLWELNEHNDPYGSGDLGYSYSHPVVSMMNNGKWAVIFGNGYNSTNGQAILYIAYLEEGINGWLAADIKRLETGVGISTNQNGLSSPTVVDLNGDSVADRIYAGDLRGNLWAFDVSATNDSQWRVAYKNSSTPKPLFKAKKSNLNQPITAKPLVVRNSATPDGAGANVLVLFGTGQYLTAADVGNQAPQSFYGVWDHGNKVLRRDKLSARTLSIDSTTGARKVTGSAMDWTTSQGWYIDLSLGNTASNTSAERSILKPLVREDAVYFNTTIPTASYCSAGGSGWIMSVDHNSGLATTKASINAVNVDQLNEINEDDQGSVGRYESSGMLTESTMVGDQMYTVVATATGNKVVKDPLPPSSAGNGQLGWQEIIPH